MRVAVVADIVSARVDFLYVVGEVVDPVAYEKKRRLDALAVENIEQLIGFLVTPCRVERDRDLLAVGLNAVNRHLLRFGGGLNRFYG